MTRTIGVDVGGTKIAAGVVEADGTIVDEARRDSPATSQPAIVEAIVDIIDELGKRNEVEAAGVGAAGFIDAARSTVLFAPNLAWRDAPLKRDVEAKVSMPVVVENDANAAAWGEFTFGAGADVADMIFLTIGTGLGGGLVLDDELYRGAYGIGGEVGHLRVVPDGHLCGCGNKGCWEQYASGSALVREAREFARSGSPQASRLLELAGGRYQDIDGPMVTKAASEGDGAAIELLDDLGRWLGEGIATLAAVLDPAVVVIGGGVSAAGDLLIEPARRAFARNLTGRGHRPQLEMRLATLGTEAGIIGAADLARRR
ncbi:ROK family glucokinase [Tenggerimyces flavus]|uniref:Glucokinase n=1 Tax=Tenggerimyces flavus TaxID=1708749 RepID=A0ABV7Y4K6_9ACTN|nr:ROK family glucokinase [Tenggerimyces flavus]MBM7788687.1 glucokinase [Tenggerimyces flavus]